MRPEPDDVRTMAVVGAGVMGHAIAQVFALAGIEVHLVDLDKQVLVTAERRIRYNLETMALAGRISETEIPGVLHRIVTTTDLAPAAAGAEFVLEAVSENPAAKQAVFSALEEAVGADVVLASNTSGLMLYDMLHFQQSGAGGMCSLVRSPSYHSVGRGGRRS